MARREALLRCESTLGTRRADLCRKLAGELDNLRNFKNLDGIGDSADAAFDSGSEEMASQLAELDAGELDQIERAIGRLKQGTYGLCEVCESKIPVGRLNVLPYSTLCINCQKEMERDPNWGQDRMLGNWDTLYDAETPLEDQPATTLSYITLDLGTR